MVAPTGGMLVIISRQVFRIRARRGDGDGEARALWVNWSGCLTMGAGSGIGKRLAKCTTTMAGRLETVFCADEMTAILNRLTRLVAGKTLTI